MFDYGHISPPKALWFSKKKTAFLTQKPDFMLFHDFSASQPSSSSKNEQNITLQLWQNSGEIDLASKIHQNMPQINCFGAFSHFFCFWNLFFEKFEPIICIYSSNVGWNILNDWYMPQMYIKQNFQISPKTKLSSIQSTVFPPILKKVCRLKRCYSEYI